MNTVLIDPGPTPYDDLDRWGGVASRATKEAARFSNALNGLSDSAEKPIPELVTTPQRRLVLIAGEGWTLQELPDIVLPRTSASRRPTKWLQGAVKSQMESMPPSVFLKSFFEGESVWETAHDSQVYDALVRWATALRLDVGDAEAAKTASRAVVRALVVRAGCEHDINTLAF